MTTTALSIEPLTITIGAEVSGVESGSDGNGRLFDARRFVIVTSAKVEDDTRVVTALHELQDVYAGDLEIELGGAEELGRRLQDAPALVHAVFGPPWAQAWCGLIPVTDAAAPEAHGLVDDPVVVLDLASTLADARSAEKVERRSAGHGRGSGRRGVVRVPGWRVRPDRPAGARRSGAAVPRCLVTGIAMKRR